MENNHVEWLLEVPLSGSIINITVKGAKHKISTQKGNRVLVAQVSRSHAIGGKEAGLKTATIFMYSRELLDAAKECLKLESDRRKDLKNSNSPAARFCDARIAKIQSIISKAEGK